MDNRQFLKIDDFLTTDEISTIDNELSQISQYTVYEEGGKYLWHIDSEPMIKPDFKRLRVANYIYYINDDFEGGELELSYKRDVEYEGEFYNTPPFVELSADKVIIPKKNTLIIMPSDMWHRVKPIIKGKRRTINGHIGFIQ